MKRFFLYAALIILSIISIVLSIAYLTPPKEIPEYSDENLRKMALSKGLKAVPTSFDKLLEMVDEPSNPMTPQKIRLGEELFFDMNLSKSKKTSCASCHSFDRNLKNRGGMLKMISSKEEQPNDCIACHLRDQSGTDRLTFSQGDNDEPHPYLLNTQTILNSAFAKHFTWSGKTKSIREHSANSFRALHKMHMTPSEVEKRVREDPGYEPLFREAFSNGITFENINSAIEAYVKTLVTRGDFDRFLDGDNGAMSKEAKRGLANFIGFGCKGCHNDITLGGQSIQRFPLREFAQVYDVEIIPELERINREFPFQNSGGYLGGESEHRFRVPILRNVTKTSPYFHNGAVPKIREAVNIMAKHQLGRHLTNRQIDEIVAFLRSLEGEIVAYDREGAK